MCLHWTGRTTGRGLIPARGTDSCIALKRSTFPTEEISAIQSMGGGGRMYF